MDDFGVVKLVPKANTPKSSETRHLNELSNDYFYVVPETTRKSSNDHFFTGFSAIWRLSHRLRTTEWQTSNRQVMVLWLICDKLYVVKWRFCDLFLLSVTTLWRYPGGHVTADWLICDEFLCHCPACRTTLVATRFRVAGICPIIQVPHCIRVFLYFVWFVFINHIFQFYYELCTYCNILDIYLS